MAINPSSESGLEPVYDSSVPLTAEWVRAADSSPSSGLEGLQVTETIEYNFVALPPAPPRRPEALLEWEPEESRLGLTPWSLGGLIFFMLANGAILWHQWGTSAPVTPLQELSALPPWQSASDLGDWGKSTQEPLHLKNLSGLKPPPPSPPVVPPSPSLAPPASRVKLAPRLVPPPPLPSLPLAQQIVPPPPKIVKTPPKVAIMPPVAVRPASSGLPSPPPWQAPAGLAQPVAPIQGNPPIEVVGAPLVSPAPEGSAPLDSSSLVEPPPSFNHQTRQRLLKIQNQGLDALNGEGEATRTQQLIQELESLNQAQ
jgi:hypothetical protein